MNYVKHFHINGVDTKQVACIELQGRPNAATEGAIGVLGMDMTSPTHEVYRCVAVNGSVYTWELLSAGMSIISATVTGEGGETKSFYYTDLLIPEKYIVKVGDLILDSEGYLYQIKTIGSGRCDATYCGTHIGGIASGDKDYSLAEEDGQLKLVTESGAIISSIDYLYADDITIYRDYDTGEIKAIGVATINGEVLRFFSGNQETYDELTDEQKRNLVPIIDGNVAIANTLKVGEIDTIEVSSGGTYISPLEPGRIYMMAVKIGHGSLWHSVPIFMVEGATEVRSAFFGVSQYALKIYTVNDRWIMMCTDINDRVHDATVEIRKI